MKKHWITILLFGILIIGLSLMLYPTAADWWNSYRQSQVVSGYMDEVTKMSDETYEATLNQALTYNQSLLEHPNDLEMTPPQWERYEKLLNLGGYGVMGYVDIPKIGITAPIYHGTSEQVWQRAIGHLEWSALPVGGEGTHCVLSGHRGLPSARLFTDLDVMAVGDTFSLCVLNEELIYEVDQIRIVKPDEVEELFPVKGQDYCTLTTCTPYGINSHRILVRGHRIENLQSKSQRVTADAVQLEPILVAPFAAMPMLLALLIAILIPKKKNRRKGK
ncbi:MAG: class C sortase [Clostridia bacterium]|nr:class C sortase [Clostridia bacterium]